MNKACKRSLKSGDVCDLQKGILVSSTASNSGKTLLTTALLKHFGNSNLQPFKVGPDYIDPQFHKRVYGVASVNLDGFMMNEAQLRWIFKRYAKDKTALIEGVMGFYDGMEKGASSYDIGKMLGVPTLIVLDASGSYTTLVAVMEGLINHKKDNTIKAVIFNRVSSLSHYKLLKELFEKSLPDIAVLGWIKKDLETLKSRHLGLDLNELDKLEEITKTVLENIDLEKLKIVMDFEPKKSGSYPFPSPPDLKHKTLTIVNDENFSFLYHDNVEFLKEIFGKANIISATKDEVIPKDTDTLYIPGGYVETKESYKRIKNSKNFLKSLKSFKGKIYAERAGLIYLGKSIKNQKTLKMAGLLDIEFELQSKRARLGYYYADDLEYECSYRGHAFHYSSPINPPKGSWMLYKSEKKEAGAWRDKNILGSYLHTMFRSETKILENYF